MSVEQKFLKKTHRTSIFLDDIESESFHHHHPDFVEMALERVVKLETILLSISGTHSKINKDIKKLLCDN